MLGDPIIEWPRLGRILGPVARVLVSIAPGDPYSRPWEDLATLAPVSSTRFLATLYFVCFITKPATTSASNPGPAPGRQTI